MKKLLSIVAVIIFFVAIAMPVSAMTDEKPTKKAKTEKRAKAKKEGSTDCATPCGEKKAAACGDKKAAACDGEKAPAPACGEKEKK